MKSFLQLSSLAVLLRLVSFAAAQQARPNLPDGTKVHRDLEYVQDGHERQRLDLYLPEKADGPLPVIVWVHGGGWLAGSKDGGGPALPFVSKGYAVAAINYRLSQHATFPAQIEDCKAAIRWLRANAKEYNLAADRIGVWGAFGRRSSRRAVGHLRRREGLGRKAGQPGPIESRSGGGRLVRANRFYKDGGQSRSAQLS